MPLLVGTVNAGAPGLGGVGCLPSAHSADPQKQPLRGGTLRAALRQHSGPRKTALQDPTWTWRASCSWRKLRGFPGQGTKVWCLPYG